MVVAQEYNHLNAMEFLHYHHHGTLNEIYQVLGEVDAEKHKVKESKEKTKLGQYVYSPTLINRDISKRLLKIGWKSSRRNFFVSTDPNVVKALEPLSFEDQKNHLLGMGHPLYDSYNQTDFVKNRISIEVQLGKYFAVTYDMFVKHLSFYNAQIMDVAIEIVPTKKMQIKMSSGPPWFEKEVHNVLRHGRTNPPVPILMLGIEP